MKFLVVVSCLFFTNVYCVPPRVRTRLEIARDLLAQRCQVYEDVCRQTPDDYYAVELAKTYFEAMVAAVARETFNERSERKEAARSETGLYISFEKLKLNSASVLSSTDKKLSDV